VLSVEVEKGGARVGFTERQSQRSDASRREYRMALCQSTGGWRRRLFLVNEQTGYREVLSAGLYPMLKDVLVIPAPGNDALISRVDIS
jgi:hypothetical protein